MYKKLDEKTINIILETGIDEFVDKGFKGANMSYIARESGVSVGVIYKYFGDKDNFFRQCLAHSLKLLDEVLLEATEGEDDISTCMRNIIYALIRHSKEHSSYNAMYNEITSGGCRQYAEDFAREIETRTSQAYRRIIANSQKTGQISSEIDPGILAFFFDSLLIMLQFSYSCSYYRQRMKIYCGDDAADEDKLAESFIVFMEAALKKGSSEKE